MRLDFHAIAVGPNRCGRTNVNALAAAGLRRAAVGTGLGVVGKKFRLFKLTHHAGQLGHGKRLIERVIARREVALRWLMQLDQRLF